MSHVSNESDFPRVQPDDISTVLVEDILDPNHLERWKQFAVEQPELARELLTRAHIDFKGSDIQFLDSLSGGKRALDLITFAYQALLIASQKIIRTPEGSVYHAQTEQLPFEESDGASLPSMTTT